MMHIQFDSKKLSRQFGRMAEGIRRIDIDAAVMEALDEVANVLLAEMHKGVERHRDTGHAYDAIERTEVQRAGNYAWVEVGAIHIRAEHKDGFHVIYQEYGSPTFAADPWLRPVMENKALVRKTVMAVFERWKIPNVKAA